jgi:hypothetical protein
MDRSSFFLPDSTTDRIRFIIRGKSIPVMLASTPIDFEA